MEESMQSVSLYRNALHNNGSAVGMMQAKLR